MAEEESQEETPKKKPPILLIIIIVNVLLGGGAGAFFFLKGSPPPPPKAEGGGGEHGDEHGEASAPKTQHTGDVASLGPLVAFQPLVVNLNEPEGTRYLKIALAVQLPNEKIMDSVEKAKPIIRDHFIRELSDLNFRQTMGNKNKLALKRRLIKRFNEAVGTDAAIDIHITQFVVQ